MSVWMIWLIAALLLIVAEITTFTFFLLWLGLGALTGSIMALLFPELYVLHFLTAAIVSVVLTYYTKRIKGKLQGSKGYTDRFDALIGKRGEVIETIPDHGLGMVLVSNETWSAEAEEVILAGENIEVVSRSSTVLRVTKLKGD